MIMKNNSSIFNLVRKLTILFILLAGSVMFIADVSAASSLKPTVSGFKVFPSTVSNSGGSVLLSAKVSNATRCIITVKPAISGVGYNKPCSSGTISYRITLPSNSTKSNILYAFKLLVTGRTGEGNVTAPLETAIVTAPPKPVISSFVTPTTTLTSAGGNVILTASVSHETSCSLSVSPAISQTLGSVPCSTGSVTFPQISLLANSSDSNIDYTFTLTVTGSNGTVSDNLIVTVDSSSDTGSSTTTTTTTTTSTTYPPVTGNTVPVAADPDAIIKVGGDIWVASCKGNEITVINDSTKQIVNEYGSNVNYQLDCPDALAFADGYVWIASRTNSSLVQLNASTGKWIQTQTGSDIAQPNYIAVTGSDIWVSNGTFLSEFNATSGANMFVTKNTITHILDGVTCIAVSGSNIWVSDSAGAEAYEYSASSGAYLRETLGGGGGIEGADCVSYDDGYIWVTSNNNNLVIEYNASTGAYIREFSIVNPSQVIFTGSKLFVVSSYPLVSVLEYNVAGRLLNTVVNKVNTGFYRANGMAMLYDGGNLWVANPASNNVTLYKL